MKVKYIIMKLQKNDEETAADGDANFVKNGEDGDKSEFEDAAI